MRGDLSKGLSILAAVLHFTCLFPPHSDLPPSQGGKYSGFGNTVQPPPKEESEFLSNAWSSLSSGWSTFSSSASNWASQAGEKASQLKVSVQEKVIKPSSEQVGVVTSTMTHMN
jgi:ADP-ribosylation factor GTPase-activating protein 1